MEETVVFAFRRLLGRYDEMARAIRLTPELHELIVNELLLELETIQKARGPLPAKSPLPVTQAAYARLEALEGR